MSIIVVVEENYNHKAYNKESVMRLRIVALSILMSLTATGCQENSREIQESISSTEKIVDEIVPEEGAKLKLIVDKEWYGKAIAEGFNKIYPDVEITIMTGTTEEINEILRLEGPKGNGPDVIMMAHDRVREHVEYGLLLPLEEQIVEEVGSQMIEEALKTAQINGVTYGLPITTEAMALYYNKDIVGEVPAGSFEQIFEFAETLEDDQYAFLTDIWDAYNAYGLLSCDGFELFGKDGQEVDNSGMESEAFKNGLAFVQQLSGIMPLTSEESFSDFANEAFINGKAAYVYSGPWELEAYRNAGVNFGVTTIPTVRGKTLTPFGGVINAHVSSYTKYRQAANLMVKYMASIEGADILYQTRHKSPGLKDTSKVKGLSDDEAVQMFVKQFESAKLMPNSRRINYYWEIVPKSVSAVFENEGSPEEVWKWTVEEWNKYISREYFESNL